MSAHDAFDLWGYAAEQLSAEARAEVEVHLPGCTVCQEKLTAVREAQRLLAQAAPAPAPTVDWRRVDDAVEKAAARRLAKVGGGAGWRWAGGFALAAAAAVLFLVFGPARTAPQELGGLTEASTVETSAGAERWREGNVGALVDGAALSSGDGLRTSASGSATVKLPDASRVRLSGDSEVVLARAARDEVTLELSRGRVTAQASHVKRKAFVVKAGGVAVQVVGTVFSVAAGERDVEVSVAEGRVRVELGNGVERFVGAGERLVVERSGRRARATGLTAGDRVEFTRLGVEASAESALAARGHTAGPPGAASRRAAAEPKESPAPESVREAPANAEAPAGADGVGTPEAQAPVDAPAVVPAAAAPTPAAIEASQPAVGGTLELPPKKALPPPTKPPLVRMTDEEQDEDEAEAEEPVAPPAASRPEAQKPPAVAQKPAVQKPVPQGPAPERLPDTVETLFLRRADEALRAGRCAAFMEGLGDVLEHAPDPVIRGKARILRARCFDTYRRPAESHREYRLYLNEFPAGPFAAEARQALAE